MNITTMVYVGSGGFLGAVCRMLLNGYINKIYPHTLPFGTLGVNLIGSFIMGILFGFFYESNIFSPQIKSFLTTGFLGALTTYSTFAMESFFLIQSGNIGLFVLNIFLNLFGTILCAGCGYMFVTKIF